MIKNSSQICIDSNIVIRLVLGGPKAEELREQWSEWVEKNVSLIAPPLFLFEITSVIWREVYQKTLTPSQGKKALVAALDQDVQIEYPKNLHARAFEISHQFNRPEAYDTHFVALAQHFKCEFWTLDKRLYNALKKELLWVRTI